MWDVKGQFTDLTILSPIIPDGNPQRIISYCVCSCACGYTHVWACGAQTLTLGFFLNCSPPGSHHWAGSSAVWLDYPASEPMASACLCCSPRAVCGYPCKPPTASFWYGCWASKLRSSSLWSTESSSQSTSQWWHFMVFFFQCSTWLFFFYICIFIKYYWVLSEAYH